MTKRTIQEVEITCPHCNNVYSDSWQYKPNDDVLECEGCEKRFEYQRFIQVTYDTQAIEETSEAESVSQTSA